MRRCIIALLALLACSVAAHAQSSPKKYLSVASNNATLVLGRPSIVKMIFATNTTATIYYLKFYNKATAPTCGTDVPVLTLPLPINNASPPVNDVGDGLLFPLGVGFCIVGGIADADNTVAAAGITVNLGISAR